MIQPSLRQLRPTEPSHKRMRKGGEFGGIMVFHQTAPRILGKPGPTFSLTATTTTLRKRQQQQQQPTSPHEVHQIAIPDVVAKIANIDSVLSFADLREFCGFLSGHIHWATTGSLSASITAVLIATPFATGRPVITITWRTGTRTAAASRV